MVDNIGHRNPNNFAARGVQRFSLGPAATPPITRREEKTTAVTRLQKWHRYQQKMSMVKVVQQARQRARRKRSDIHGTGSGDGFAFGSDSLHKITGAAYDQGRSTSSIRLNKSDVRSGDQGSANILGSDQLHEISAQSGGSTSLKKSDIRNFSRSDSNTMVFGSEEMQNRMASSWKAKKNTQRAKTDVHGYGENDGFAYGSQNLHQITGASHDYGKQPRGRRKIQKDFFEESSSAKQEPRGRKRADIHGSSENQLSWGSQAARERQLVAKMEQASKNMFGRRRHTDQLHGSGGGGLNLGSQSLQNAMQEHEAGKVGGSLNAKRAKLRNKQIAAADLIANRWRARMNGEKVRNEMQMKMANMMLGIAAMKAEQDGKELGGTLGEMARKHDAFVKGPGTQRSQYSLSTGRSSLISHRSGNTVLPLPSMPQQKDTPAVAVKKKPELPKKHGKKTFNYYEGVHEVDQRFCFGSRAIAEGQIYGNMMERSKQKPVKNTTEFSEMSGKNVFGHDDTYKAFRGRPNQPRKMNREQKNAAILGNSKSMPSIGQYGRKNASDLRSQSGNVCAQIGSTGMQTIKRNFESQTKRNGKPSGFKDESGFLFGSQALMDRHRSDGDVTDSGNPNRISAITAGPCSTPEVGGNRRQYGFVDRMDGEARLKAKLTGAMSKPVPLKGDGDYFKFSHGSEQLRHLQNKTPNEDARREGNRMVYGSNSQKNRVAFCSPTFNKQHEEYEAKTKDGPRFAKPNMLFGFEAPRKVETDAQRRRANAERWKPERSKHAKQKKTFQSAGKNAVCKNDYKLYGSGGFKGREIDTTSFTSGFFESPEYRKSFSKETGVSGKAPY